MPLPSSGEISFSDINTELGQSSDAELSIDDAAQGNVSTINTNSANTPDSSTPHSISEWYGYDHSATAGLTEFNAGGPFEESFLACEIQDAGGTFYHNGAESLPTNGDSVYEDDSGSSAAPSGWYFVNIDNVVYVDGGSVSDVSACP